MNWPDPNANWQFPTNTVENRSRWQGAIDAALETGSLSIEDGEEPNALWLNGSCPRCNHRLRQRIRYNVMRRLDSAVKTNVDCSCGEQHEGRAEDMTGCGWGGPLPVELHPWGN